MKLDHEPHTPQQWQEAVDAAAACRMVADCILYGLIQGGPDINVARCDDIIDRGRRLGVQPSKDAAQLALEYIAAWNAERGSHAVS